MAVPVIPEYDVSTGKSKESKNFDFYYSAKLARTLAETLYDYKIEAVVREYATNITDSHNDSGKEGVEGQIHLPTKLNPIIRFHDFGLGMSKDTIFNIYTKFGLSTKEHDNTTNGSLGYGSKSAFAVSDQFTVTSFKDGVKTVVICYKDRTGLPTSDLKSETSTEQPNGTVVEIPVEMGKVEQWQKAAAFVLGAFRVPHKVNTFGVYRDEYDAMISLCKKCRKEGSVFVQKPSSELEQHRSNTLVLMGDVAYHLPDFNNLIMNSGVKYAAENMIDNGLYITSFNIGDLDYAPSRESISYDPETYKKIKHRVNKDVIKYTRSMIEDFGGLDNDISFYSFYRKFKNSAIYDALRSVKLPFLKGSTLHYLDPTNKGSWSYDKKQFLDDEHKYGKIRGYIEGATLNGFVFSNAIHKIYQDRLVDVEKPIVVYSEKEKGLSNIRKTLDNIFKHYNTLRPVFYTDSLQQAKNLSKWFEAEDPICGDSFSPVSEKKSSCRKGVKRGGFGVKGDFETVATVMTLKDNGYTQRQEKVDLSEEGVYYVEGEYFDITGLVKGFSTTLTLNDYKTRNLLREASVKKVVYKNKNNQGKIKRSGIKPLGKIVSQFVKQNKKDFIKYSIWNKSLGLSYIDKIIASKVKSYKQLVNRINSLPECPNHIIVMKTLSNFHLNNTPLWKMERGRRNNLEQSLNEDIRVVKEKLPLLNYLKHSGEEDIKHYLRLEKVIK